ncbi:hypothetical protein BRD03_04010 [Halobacteriales archaeon QS_9_68_17]|nr:MAG: hypothetical protein BRD03_04010 [Halobacteriales archaeon QS_9_68_17]
MGAPYLSASEGRIGSRVVAAGRGQTLTVARKPFGLGVASDLVIGGLFASDAAGFAVRTFLRVALLLTATGPSAASADPDRTN